jgi:hypothetical protein
MHNGQIWIFPNYTVSILFLFNMYLRVLSFGPWFGLCGPMSVAGPACRPGTDNGRPGTVSLCIVRQIPDAYMGCW